MILASFQTHIDNGGFTISINEEDGCVSFNTEYSYCEFSHSSSLFCGSNVGPKELEAIGRLCFQAADTLRAKDDKNFD